MTTEQERRLGRERRRFNQRGAPSLGEERRRHTDQRKRLLVEYRMHDAGDATGPYWTTHVSIRPKQ